MREADGEALTLAVAENVIRADLSPIEEARAYRRLVDEHGDAAKVARLVGKSERLIAERLDLLRLPDGGAGAARRAQAAARLRAAARPDRGARAAARRPDGRMARRATAATRPSSRPIRASSWTTCSRAEWTDDDGQPLHPVAYSVERVRLTARSCRPPSTTRTPSPPCSRSSASMRSRSRPRSRSCRRSRTRPSTTGRRGRPRRRAGASASRSTDDDADAARAFGCLLELSGRNGPQSRLRHRPRVARGSARRRRSRRTRPPRPSASSRESDERTPGRVAGRPREGGAAAGAPAAVRGARLRPRAQPRPRRGAREWQPKLDTDAVKLLGSLVLHQHGKAAAWAHRLCVEQPTTDEQAGQGDRPLPARRGGRAEAPRRGDRRAQDAPARPRTRSRSSCACSSLSGSSTPPACRTPTGRASTSRRSWPRSPTLDKLARRVAPASVKQHLAEQEAEREQREQAWRDEQAARLQRAAREARRWRVRPLRVLPRPDRVGRRRRREARRARPRRRLRAAVGQRRPTSDEEAAAMTRPSDADLVTSIARETQMHLDP